MLEVVEQQQELALTEKAAQVVGGADRLRDLGRHETRVGERAEGDPEDTVGHRADELGRDLKRESRLARAARPSDRDDASTLEQVYELGDFSLAPEERTCRDRQIRRVERPERRELAVTELEEVFRLDEVLQPVLAEVAESSVRSEEVMRRT